MRSSLNLLARLDFLPIRRKLELFPPFFLMRVKIISLADDWSSIRLHLPLNWASANAAGHMYGGYQASLADPIPAVACMHHFPGYRVATRKLEIDFIRSGNSDLILHFDFPAEMVAAIEQELKAHGRATPCFHMQLVRADGQICTEIRNSVAIRPADYISPHESQNQHS
ncbi:hypothetical protein FE236_03365 [Mariprofundus erugo]|uniref:Thioesterase domain-containing protein n=1 Tax=Mariprofundus erugo TaxID=2528639 RepID=A0A5R9GSS7_9PROT|nr:hotdog domain-containing protein [Mariprofundus erugo]TLS68658.1 hypothetical protein FEF65_02845 [Mariprofundus erugo]TLS77649.1 hypothetical protein FE236_03365 [Mariprofundus erugo]